MSQWVASPFEAASSFTSAERSWAVSVLTSSGSCGPTLRRQRESVPGAETRATELGNGHLAYQPAYSGSR